MQAEQQVIWNIVSLQWAGFTWCSWQAPSWTLPAHEKPEDALGEEALQSLESHQKSPSAE